MGEDSAGRKGLSKVQGKSLSALRQKLRKYIRESHEDDVAKFRENPDEDDDEPEDVADEEGSGDDDTSDFSRAKSEEKEVRAKKKKDLINNDYSFSLFRINIIWYSIN